MTVEKLIEKYKSMIDLLEEEKAKDKGLWVGHLHVRQNVYRDIIRDLKQIEIIEHNQNIKIPKFVAEWLEVKKKNKDSLHVAIDGDWQIMPKKMKGWLGVEFNDEKFARAWLDGYEVEEEPRFITILVTNASHKWLLARTEAGNIVLEKVSLTMFKEKYSTERYILNKGEIMSVDQGDKLFKNFAIEVEKGVHGWKIKSR